MIKFFKDLRSEIDQMAMDVPGLFVFAAGCFFGIIGCLIAIIAKIIYDYIK